MKKVYDLAVRTSSYTDKEGQEKSSWLNIGSIWKNNDDNQFMLLKAAFNPAAIERKPSSDCITVAMFEPRDTSNSNQVSSENSDLNQSYDDNGFSIPFQ